MNQRSALLLQSAILILTRKEHTMKAPAKTPRKIVKITNKRTGRPIPDPDTIEHEGDVKDVTESLDTPMLGDVESAFINSQPKETPMSYHEDHSEYTETVNPLPVREPTKQELKAAAAQAKVAAKAAKKEATELAKAEKAVAKLAAIQAKNSTTKEERDAAKAARAERIAALDPDGTKKYHGSMLALADRVKQGVYVKGATGQLRSTNELAEVLDAVPVDNVIRLAKIVLELPENPYAQLNSGQQSMNLRNRMRGAIKKGTLTLDAIRECIEENGFATATDWAAAAEAKRETRAANAAAAKSAKEAKAAAKEAAAA
jgi:hypothetical protein